MEDLATDLLWGAGAIAQDLFGANTAPNRRRVYHLHEQGRLPTWKHGPTIVSKRSEIRKTFAGPDAATQPATKTVAA